MHGTWTRTLVSSGDSGGDRIVRSAAICRSTVSRSRTWAIQSPFTGCLTGDEAFRGSIPLVIATGDVRKWTVAEAPDKDVDVDSRGEYDGDRRKTVRRKSRHQSHILDEFISLIRTGRISCVERVILSTKQSTIFVAPRGHLSKRENFNRWYQI